MITNFQEETSSKFVYCEEAMEALLESVACEENSATQASSALILSNLGGTYSWSGEPYTIPWLLKKAGLASLPHKNMIKNVDFSDKCLQVLVLSIFNLAWCSVNHLDIDQELGLIWHFSVISTVLNNDFCGIYIIFSIFHPYSLRY